MVGEDKYFLNKLEIFSVLISKKTRKRKAYCLSMFKVGNYMNEKSNQQIDFLMIPCKAFKSHRALKRLRFFLNFKRKPR